LRTFVQKYTPIRSNGEYVSLIGKHPSAKLVYFSYLYYFANMLYYDDYDMLYNFNIKTNGLKNSLSMEFCVQES